MENLGTDTDPYAEPFIDKSQKTYADANPQPIELAALLIADPASLPDRQPASEEEVGEVAVESIELVD